MRRRAGLALRAALATGVVLALASPAAAQERPSIALLSPAASDVPVGPTKLEASPSNLAAGDAVEFFVDGRRVGSASAPPWSLSWDAGDSPAAHAFSAVVLRGGREVASAKVSTRGLGYVSRVTTRAVSVAAVVSDESGRYVRGLPADAFTILDDGRSQKIETFDATDSPLSAILVLDVSGSMLFKFADARRAAHRFLDALRPDDEVSLLTFNSSVVGAVEFTKSRAPLHAGVDAARTAGETALYDVCASALQRLKRRTGRKALVLFTDGEDNRSRLAVDQLITMARASEVSIYAVAQGVSEAKTLKVFLDRMADETGGRSYFIGEIKKLPTAFDEIVAELRSQYYMTYTPANAVPRTWHRIDVKVDRSGARVRAKKSYFVE